VKKNLQSGLKRYKIILKLSQMKRKMLMGLVAQQVRMMIERRRERRRWLC
jgi:hypothetical protein